MASPSRYLGLGFLGGLLVAAAALGLLYLQGYHLMAPHPPVIGSAPGAPQERQILCYRSPQDPSYISERPGQDPHGHELVPVYADEAPAPQPPKPGRKIKYWMSPMDPGYVRDQPGKAPCGMDLVPVYEDEPDSAPEVITVAPGFLQSMGVRTARAQTKYLVRPLRAVGLVTYDERRLYTVTTKVRGWVEHLYPRATGEPIRRGQPLLRIYSPELVSAQEEYLQAWRYQHQLRASPFPEVRDSAARLLAAARQRLENWDLSAAQIADLERRGQGQKHLLLFAPASGIVVKRLVSPGMLVEPGMPLLEVVDLSRVWVEAEIYESELPLIQVGQPAQVTLAYLPGETFTGTVEYLYPYLQGTTRTARVRLTLPNPGLKLKPEMYAQVELQTPLGPPVVAVPAEAVLNTGERQYVFLALGQGRFQPRQVQVGRDSGTGWLEILAGLQGGEEVVTSAQFLLDSEARFREAIAQMLKPTTPAPAGGPPAPAPPPKPPVHHHH